jgi:triacylglycerol lipase
VDIELAHRLAVVSGEVYRAVPRLDSVLPGATVRAYHNGSTQCFVIDHPTMVVIAFRGTEPTKLGDLWTDAQAITRRKRPGMPGGLHRGIATAVDGVTLRLFATLCRELGTRPLYLTGHSLGGALAVVFATDLVRWRFGDRLTGVYTFGAPRVTTPRAARWLERQLPGKLFRFQNAGDPVVRLPPWLLIYSHVGELFPLRGGRRGHGIATYQRTLESGLAAVA